MFLGHVAVGLAAKKAAPKASLGWLVAAPTLLDLLWPVFLALGLEEVRIAPGITAVTPLDFVRYPISHSLFLSVVWGLVAAGFYLASRSDRTGAAVVGLLVVSHWVLDWVSHRPDMPLAPWPGTKVGLGLWNSVPATLVVELGLFAVGVWIYARTTEARDRIGIWAFAVFAGLLAAIYIGNVFGPPPPSVAALNVVAFAGFLIPVWAVWFDRHREPRIPA